MNSSKYVASYLCRWLRSFHLEDSIANNSRRSLLSLPEPPGFLPNVLAAVERDWLAYAAEELLVARWVTITSTGGHRTVQRQLDDGRGRKERGGHLFDKEKGLHKTWEVPSFLILTVQDSEFNFDCAT